MRYGGRFLDTPVSLPHIYGGGVMVGVRVVLGFLLVASCLR